MMEKIKYETLQEVIAENLSIEPELVKLDSNLESDLGVDSFDLVELVMNCEEKYGVSIPDEVANELYTPRLILDYLNKDL